jgi:L-fucose/D-arabinose isomerase
MKMDRNAAVLYAKELKYPDGTPVDCTIADSCIGGLYEASQCAKTFAILRRHHFYIFSP